MDSVGTTARTGGRVLHLVGVALTSILASAAMYAATVDRGTIPTPTATPTPTPTLTIDPNILRQIPGQVIRPDLRIPVRRSVVLTASSTQVRPGSAVDFQAQVKPSNPPNTLFYFSIDGRIEPNAPHGSAYQKRFRQAGTYAVSVKANLGPDSPELISNVVRVTVEQPPPVQYSLRLDTRGQTRIQAGQAVDFLAQLSPDAPSGTRYAFQVDGNTVRGLSPSNSFRHTFQQAGDYRVTTTANPGLSRRVVNSNSVTIQVAEPLPPPPRVSISPPFRTAVQGDPVEFSSAADPDGGHIASYEWVGANRQTSRSRTFAPDTAQLSPGHYPIDLTVKDSHGQRGEASATLEVKARPRPRQAPLAAIEPQNIRVRQGRSAGFNSRSTVDPDTGLRLAWTGPNGQTARTAAFSVDTTRLAPGDYLVHLTVTDGHGDSDTARARLRVLEPPGRLEAAIDPPVINAAWGQPVRFRSISVIPTGARADLTWHLPDGRTGVGELREIDTAMLSPGDFQIGLTVEIQDGRRDETAARLTVAPPRLLLSSDRSQATVGEPVRFDAVLPSTAAGQRYLVHFGDDDVATLGSNGTAQHGYGAEGVFLAYLSTIVRGQTFESNRVRVRVVADKTGAATVDREPPSGNWPLWVWLAPLLALLSGLVMYRLLRPAPVMPATIEVMPVPDDHGPTIEIIDVPPADLDIKLVLVRDPGEQTWEPTSAGEEPDHD